MINGNKIFTSMAQFCDYLWLAARTDPDAPKHKGISIFMIDINTPGITVDPLMTMGGLMSCFTYYDNVRVPKSCLIGEENKGWTYAKALLSHERTAIAEVANSKRSLALTKEYAAREVNGGKSLLSDPMFQTRLSDVEIELLEDFWQSVAANALCNLHVLLHYGRNSHHISEAIFKGAARALRMATSVDPRMSGIPSTKGVLQ